ncbi:MAG: ATP-binding cassette domain-containing protein [Chloroflexi bacterium]|nr:ATP-binding cassette domain-containing protein [Chloroflexota bacterium]
MQTAVEVDNLVRRYGDFVAVDHLSFEVHPGEIFGLLGPNGAGKSTTIRTLMGIFPPDEGEVRVLGTSPRAAQPRVGYLPEERGLYRDLQVVEVLLYLAELKGMPRHKSHRRALAWLERVRLLDWANERVKDLSRGMQQKLQFIASLIHEPDLVVLDEPFQGLDPVNVALIKGLIRDLAESGMTVMLSAHEMSLVEALCDRILLINKGQAVLYGSLREIKRAYAGQTINLSSPDRLPDIAGVTHVERVNGSYRLTLADAQQPADVLQNLLTAGVTIDAFEVAAAPLEEIFVSIVEARDELD